MNTASLAEYVAAQKRRTPLPRAERSVPCPNCGHDCGLLIRSHGKLYCEACAPKKRRCARCKHWFPLHVFDVTPNTKLGWRIESYCVDCRREARREQFAEAQRSDRPIVSHQVCRACGKDKPHNAFDVDKRYAGGLETICQRCKNEQGYARGRAR